MKIEKPFTSLLLFSLILWIISACRIDNNTIVDLSPTQATTKTDKLQSTIANTTPAVDAGPEIRPTNEFGLVVSQVSLFYDKAGLPGVVGLVRNDSSDLYIDSQVIVQFFDPADQLLDTKTTNLLISHLHPGETSPFLIMSEEKIPNLDHINSLVSGFQTGYLERGEVVVRNELLTTNSTDEAHLTGELYNGSLDPVMINSIAVALFDGEGEIISAAAQAAAIRYLDPGEFGPFRVTLPITMNTQPVNYSLYIDAKVIPPLPYPNIIIDENPNPFLDQNSIFHLSGEVNNKSEHTLFVNLIAGIYDTNGIVLDASSTRLPVSIDPGETLPYDFSEWGLMSKDINIRNQAIKFSVQLDIYPYPDTGGKFILLTTQNNEFSFDGNSGVFTGEIINTSGQTLSLTKVIVSVYDTISEHLIKTGEQVFQKDLPDGDTFRYEVTIDLDEKYDPNMIDVTHLAKGRTTE